jgi:hypothetical protein
MEPGERQSDRARGGTEGAVFIEFLIAFIPVLTTFLCLCQLAILFAVKLVVEHAAINAARTAAVVIGDDPKAYSGTVEPLHEVKKDNARYDTIRRAAILTLGPFIVNGLILNVDVKFPPSNTPAGDDQSAPKWSPMNGATIDKVRVQVEATALCKIGLANRIACGGLLGLFGYPTHKVRAEAVYPYQGASYEYP